MPRINWLDKLNDEQAVYAAKVMEKAEQMGVPTELALSIAYQESGFNPNRIGEAKEIGIMQVLPSTGRMMGYTPGQLHDPDTNIEAGLKYLKEQLNTFGNAPEIAALAYNRGPGVANQFIAGESDAAGEKYVQSLQGLGAFSGTVQVEDQPERSEIEVQMEALGKATPEQKAETEQKAEKQQRLTGQMIGAGVGGIGSAYMAGKSGALKAATALGEAAETGRIAAQARAGIQPAGALPTGAGATGLSQLESIAAQRPAAPGSVIADAGYLAKGETGVQVYNTAKSVGFTDMEAADFVKRGRTAKDVYEEAQKRRSAGFKRVEQAFPRQTFVENPQYGGLLTEEKGVGRGPRAEYVQSPPEPAQPGQPAQTSGLRQLPRPKPLPPPPRLSGLEMVTQQFRAMAQPWISRAAIMGRYAIPPLALAGTGGELVSAERELRKPQPDPVSVGASTAGALGGVLSLFAPMVGVPLSIAGPVVRHERERMKERYIPPEQIQKMLQGQQPDMSGMIRGLGSTQAFQ